MTQSLAPVANVSVGNWNTVTAPSVWEAVAVAGDVKLAFLNSAGSPSAFRVQLAAGADPFVDTGHVIVWRAAVDVSLSGTRTLQPRLYQGATLISTGVATTLTSTAQTDYSFAVPEADAAAITDYTDLRIDLAGVTNSRTLLVDYVGLTLPDAPVAANKIRMVI